MRRKMSIGLNINKLRSLSMTGATTGNDFDDLNLLKFKIKEISYELERLINQQNKIFLIEATDTWYDCFTGFAIIAKNEKEARTLADKSSSYGDEKHIFGNDIWTNKSKSTCKEITLNKESIILSAFNAG